MKLIKPIGGDPSELCINIAEYLGCDCEYFPPMENRSPVLEAFYRAVNTGKKGGFIPVIVEINDVLAESAALNTSEDRSGNIIELEREKIDSYRRRLIRRTTDSDANEFFRKSIDELKIYNDPYALGTAPDEKIENGEAIDFIRIPSSDLLYCEILIVKIPVSNPWEIAAWLPFGSKRYGHPSPKHIIAIAKRWYEKYGAVICAVSYQTIQFQLPKPIKSQSEAYALAKEQYFFCQDICFEMIDQPLGTLADSLMKSNVWYFWWD